MNTRSAVSGGLDGALLRFLLIASCRCRPLLEAAGVEYHAFRELLQVRLLQDNRPADRGPGTRVWFRSVGFGLLLAFNVHLAIVLGGAAFVVHDPFAYVTLATSFTMLMVAFPLIADHARVLLDPYDLPVLTPLPVSERTVLAARMAHVTLYLAMVAATMTLPVLPLAAWALDDAAFVPAYLACAFLAIVLVVSVVLLAYLVALRGLDFARFEHGLVGVQAALLVVLFGGLYVGPRLAAHVGIDVWIRDHPAWVVTFPPAWFGGLYRVLTGDGAGYDRALAVLAVVAPVAGVLAVAMVTRQGILARLEATLTEGNGAARRRRHGLTGRLAYALCGDPVERAGYGFVLAASSGDRGFKLRTLPGLAPLISIPVVAWTLGPEWPARLLPLSAYVLVLVLVSAMDNALYTERPDAAAVFESLDRNGRGRFARGAAVALTIRFLVIPLAVVVPACVALAGPATLFDALLAAEVAFFLGLFAAPFFLRAIPVSRRVETAGQHTAVAVTIVAMTVITVAVVAQFTVAFLPGVTTVLAGALLPWTWVAWRRFRGARFDVEPTT